MEFDSSGLTLADEDNTIAVVKELARARSKFPVFNSAHEGFAVLKEEVDELWDEVKRKNDGSDGERVKGMRVEGTQVAAMALRFLGDVC